MQQKHFEVPQAQPYQAYAPQRWPSVKSDVTVPFLQAVISAALFTALITTGASNFYTVHRQTITLIFIATLIIAWFWRLGLMTETLWSIEDKLALDIDRDGYKGPPPPPPLRLEIQQGNRQQILELPGLDDHARLRQFAILCLTNRLTERATKAAFGWPRERYQDVRDKMIDRGFAEWNGLPGTTQGVSLTREGRDVMQTVLDHVT